MPTISDITNAASYQGNAALGGGGGFVLDVDLKPIQQLAQYTFLYNKSQYDQRQKDADQKIHELADLSAYDLTTARGKDKEAVIQAVATLTDAGKNYSSKGVPKSPQDKINQEIDFQKQIQEAKKIITSANARGMAYNIQKAAIESTIDNAAIKAEKIKQLDRQFDESDILTPIQAVPNFEMPNPKFSTPVIKATDVLVNTPNGNIHQTVSFFDPKATMNKAFLNANNLELKPPPGPNATQLEKDEYAVQSKIHNENTVLQSAAEFYNRALNDPKYKTAENTLSAFPDLNTQKPSATIDYKAIENDNPVLHNVLSLIDRHNEWTLQKQQDAKNGYYIDKMGKKVELLQTVNPSDFFTIDKSKPITPAIIDYLQAFSDAAPDTKVEKYDYTGDATKIQIEKLNEAGANWRAKLPYVMAKIGAGTATTTQIEQYPIQKTWELLQSFVDTKTGQPNNKTLKFSELTPEQQQKLTNQINAGGTERINTDKIQNAVVSFVPPSTNNPNGQLKIIGGDNNATVLINPDDITFDYFNSINKNDAGKEGAQRLFFNISAPPDAEQSSQSAKAAPPKQNASANTINISDVPSGTKLVLKKGKYYYNGKEVIQ